MSILALGLIARLVVGSTATNQAVRDAAVLKAAVGEICPGNYLVFDSLSVEPPPFRPDAPDPAKLLQGSSTEALQDLGRRNRDPRVLPLLDICPGALVATHEEIQKAFDDTSPPETAGLEWRWEGFYRAFPGAWGQVQLSVPGYSTNGRRAVVFLAVGRGATAGYGEYVWLTKKGDRWIVSNRNGLWVA